MYNKKSKSTLDNITHHVQKPKQSIKSSELIKKLQWDTGVYQKQRKSNNLNNFNNNIEDINVSNLVEEEKNIDSDNQGNKQEDKRATQKDINITKNVKNKVNQKEKLLKKMEHPKEISKIELSIISKRKLPKLNRAQSAQLISTNFKDLSFIAPSILKKGINKECFQNLSQLPMKGHYKVIAEQNFDIMNRKKERGKKMNHYNFDKSFSINHSYISDINSSELTKLKRNLINKTKTKTKPKNQSMRDLHHIHLEKFEEEKENKKDTYKSKSLEDEVNWSKKSRNENTFLDNSTLLMMKDLDLSKDKIKKEEKNKKDYKTKKKSKSPQKKNQTPKKQIEKKETKKSKSPPQKEKRINKKSKSKSKSPSGKEEIGAATNQKKKPLLLKKQQYDSGQVVNKFRSTSQKIKYTPINRVSVKNKKGSKSNVDKKQKTNFSPKKFQEKNKSLEENFLDADEKGFENSLIYEDDLGIPTEKENVLPRYKKQYPNAKHSSQPHLSKRKQFIKNEIINENRKDNSHRNKDTSSNNSLKKNNWNRMTYNKKRTASTYQYDQKSTPTSITSHYTKIPGNLTRKSDNKSVVYPSANGIPHNRVAQTAKASSSKKMNESCQLFEIIERKKLNSSKPLNYQNKNTLFVEQKQEQEEKPKKRLPRGPRVPFSNISQEYIDKKKQMFMELMKDPSNPYSLYWTDKFLAKTSNMTTSYKGTINCVPNISIINNNSCSNKDNEFIFEQNKKSQTLFQNEINDCSPELSTMLISNNHQFCPKMKDNFAKTKTARNKLVQYPSIYKYFN